MVDDGAPFNLHPGKWVSLFLDSAMQPSGGRLLFHRRRLRGDDHVTNGPDEMKGMPIKAPRARTTKCL